MAGGGGNKNIFLYCTDPSGQEILHLRALQGHSGRNPIDPTLQDNVLIPNNFFEYIHHIGCAVSLHTITNSGLIPGGQNSSRDRQTVFFTAVNPMDRDHKDPYELDLTKPRHASYPAHCISKAIVMKSEEIIYQKVYVSPRPPPTISFKDNWTCNLDSDVARSSKDIQQIQPKPNTQLSSTGRHVRKRSEEPLERTKFDRDTLNQEKHDSVTDPTSTVRPVCGHESTERRDPTSTGRPVTVDQKEEHNIDFRVPRLSYSVVKEAEHIRFHELVQRIENHPHGAALQADLQQNNI